MKWVPADVGKGPLPFPSKICSLDWMGEKHLQEGVGEVWNTPRTFHNTRKPFGLEGNHYCGTEDEFRNGEVFSAEREPQLYHPSGIPLCCDPIRREAAVPVSIGGTSIVIRSDPYYSQTLVSVNALSLTVRSDPYYSLNFITAYASLILLTDDPYHSVGLVAVSGTSSDRDEQTYHSVGLVAVSGTSTKVEVCGGSSPVLVSTWLYAHVSLGDAGVVTVAVSYSPISTKFHGAKEYLGEMIAVDVEPCYDVIGPSWAVYLNGGGPYSLTNVPTSYSPFDWNDGTGGTGNAGDVIPGATGLIAITVDENP